MSEYEMLKQLLENFYITSNGGLEWMWIEDVTIGDKNKELQDNLLLFMEKFNLSGD